MNMNTYLYYRLQPTLHALRRLSIRAIDPTKLLHPSHLQLEPQTIPAPRSSQYFFRHADFRHLHPVVCASAENTDVQKLLSLRREDSLISS